MHGFQPPAPQAPVPPPPALAPSQISVGGSPLTGPADVFRAFQAQREELGEQLSILSRRRESIAEQLEDPMMRGASRLGLEQRITELDARILALDKQIAQADAQVAGAAAIPGATVEPPEPPRSGPPEEVFAFGLMFMVIVLLPISIAFARRVWRRSGNIGAAVASMPRELGDRLARMEQAIESTSIEVERIGEGQRFVTRVLTESNATHRIAESVQQGHEKEPAASARPNR